MIASDYLVFALATIMWNRQGKDGFPCMTAQGLMIRNRVLAGLEGQNWMKLIQEHDKYSGTPPESPELVWGDPIRDDKFRRCMSIANNIYEGREKDIICGAIRACILDQCTEEFVTKVVRPQVMNSQGQMIQLHPRVAQVGRWTFFK
jgi:hypothetical protein